MNLKDIEAIFELRFVEQLGTQEVTTIIDKFPAIVGHKGDVKPLILNGQISAQHCEISWNFVKQEYVVLDGAYGRPSTNHIYFSDGGELILCDRAVLRTLSDRVYLMQTMNGKVGYLELFDPNKTKAGNERSTLDLDPQLVELKVTAIDAKAKAIEGLGVANETKAIVQKNSAAIGELDASIVLVNQTLAVLKTAGTDARLVILGTVAVGFAGLTGLSLLFLHANMDNIYKDVRDRNQHNERITEPDRPMAPGR